MGRFVLIEPEYPRVSEVLLSTVEGFGNSTEYEQLSEAERQLPGVVAASFTRFFMRLQEAEARDGLSDRNARILDQAYRAIERLASSRDEQVRTLVRDEVFENIRGSELTWRLMESRFGPQSEALYEEWRRRNPT